MKRSNQIGQKIKRRVGWTIEGGSVSLNRVRIKDKKVLDDAGKGAKVKRVMKR